MQDLSFDFQDPTFKFNGLSFEVQIFTFENVYGLDPARCTISQYDGHLSLRCNRLRWAGGQEQAEGQLVLNAHTADDFTRFEIEASCPKTIRCIKLLFRQIPAGVIVNLRETNRQEIPPQGLIYRYPDGWRGLYTPLVVLQEKARENTFRYFRSLDARVREKRFAFLPKPDGLTVELIFEAAATEMGQTVRVPVWEVGECSDPQAIMEKHSIHLAHSYELIPWEERPDVPAWAKKISLVAAIHGQHYTGYIFNDYQKILDTLVWLATRIEPDRVLVYLPGWEGRYYWQYGDYRPDPRMGGEAGFARLMAEAKAMGFHMMPMFGINVVNRGLENFEQWGAPALTSQAGGVSPAGSVDWDSARHHDHAWGAVLNPGAPVWQNRLVGQILSLIDNYGFDSLFLDISAVWFNDPRYNTYSGVLELIRRIRENYPELLVGGEGWYDGIGLATPLVQSGHSEGVLHWHDEPYAPLFDRYTRSFAHLCLGDPGRGSTGVHELGYNPINRSPLRQGIIPTVTLVEDTLQKNPDGVLQIIEDAKTYADTYLVSKVKTD